MAIEFLSEMERDGVSVASEDEQQERLRLRRDLSGTYGERDSLGKEILSAVETIENKLNPVARLEAGM